jgi:hypothetical protein
MLRGARMAGSVKLHRSVVWTGQSQLWAVQVDLAVGASGKIIPRRRMSGSSTEL